MSPSKNVMDPTDPTGLSPPAPISNTELRSIPILETLADQRSELGSSPSTNRKRTRDEPSPLKPAKRQNSQPSPATGPEIAQMASQSNTDLPTVSYISQVGIVLGA
ncbi:unnamed protein product [Fusarium graminearum]|uniref:Chromosome 2, complete genome n=1 Tax=Gibberella zeae (strain ATCC MYA-4620 / CBS 123657 / FGSC 9075 / NRRL 31084 / PH-1) TaxID=229533 RepID=A0A098DJ75_GIBZE|nr:unnamed protein product [Fusarium graminearum]CEF78482.1 unnamed protein product [Fusarium graminearum]